MFYAVAYAVLYCLSVFLLQKDWRTHSDLKGGTVVLILFLSIFLFGILWTILEFVGGLLNNITVAKKY